MKKILLLFLLFFTLIHSKAQLPKLQLNSFSSGYTSPLDIENCGDDRLFIVQQTGEIFICNSSGKKNKTPFLDIRKEVSHLAHGRGLLGLAFDPNYANDGFFYVNYIDTNQNTQISRFKVSKNKNVADAASEVSVIQVAQPYKGHFGGCLRFGPDGFLYIGFGDGDEQDDPNNYAQNPSLFLGKMLRLNVRSLPYKIPSTNPFIGSSNYRPEIWALGLRNPWRFSFDDKTGDLWIGDVGENMWEEVDRQNASSSGGENYGWRCFEGKHSFDSSGCNAKKNYTFPLIDYSHADSNCAVMGGFVYRGKLYPNMVGKYFFADYCSGDFKVLYKDNDEWKKQNLLKADNSFVTFGEDKNKELYTANIVTGIVYHLVDKSSGIDNFSNSSSSNNSFFSIYPNPSKGIFMINYNNILHDREINISIYNMIGKKVYESTREVISGTNNLQVNLPNLKGDYYIQLSNKSGKLSGESILIN